MYSLQNFGHLKITTYTVTFEVDISSTVKYFITAKVMLVHYDLKYKIMVW